MGTLGSRKFGKKRMVLKLLGKSPKFFECAQYFYKMNRNSRSTLKINNSNKIKI